MPLHWLTEDEDRYKLWFSVSRSIRYHNYRRRFYGTLDSCLTFFILLAGSANFALAVNQAVAPWILGVFITVFASIKLAFQISTKATLHTDLYRRFIQLEKRLYAQSRNTEVLYEERLSIESDEPSTYQALNRICHNEVLRTEDRFELFEPLRLHHRLLCNFLPFTHLPKKPV